MERSNKKNTQSTYSAAQTPFIQAKGSKGGFIGAKKESPFFAPAPRQSAPIQHEEAPHDDIKHIEQQQLAHQTIRQRLANPTATSSSKVIQGGFWGKVWGGIKSVASTVSKGAKKVGSGLKAVGRHLLNVAESVGHWAKDLVLEAPKRIFSIVKHVGSGIFKTASWLFDGAKGVLGHLFDGFKGTIGWLGKGVKGAFGWLAHGLKGGASWAKKLLHGDFSGFWSGIGSAFSWLGRGAKGLLKWGGDGLKGLAVWAKSGIVGFGKWLGKGLLGGFAWAGRMAAKLFDLIGGGEAVEVLWQIVKFNTRPLNGTERAEAVKVFGGSIDYRQVRIDEKSLISKISSLFVGAPNAVTTFHTINFPAKINAQPCNRDMHWLIHELGHVAQYTHVGSQYMGEAIAGQFGAGYSYGGGAGLVGKNFKNFNREQQSDIIADFYGGVVCNMPEYTAIVGGHTAEYLRLKEQWQAGNM